MNTICVIGIYYGEFNDYFPLWLKSCAYNQNIDFIIVTDIEYTEQIPENVKFVKLNMADLKEMASKKLRVHVELNRPYKCCDLRPFYGIILEDYIKNYEYWGHTDFDMIYGDIYGFMLKNNYKLYDKFLPLGHLSFYKNTEKVNNYYKLDGSVCGNYKEVLTNDRNFLFDENSGINAILIKHNIPFFTRRLFADITPIFRRYTISTGSSIDGFVHANYRNQIFYWEKGKIFRAYYNDGHIHKEEFIYLHHRCRPNFRVNSDLIQSDSFYITYSGFIKKEGEVTLDMIRRYNYYPGKIIENIQKAIFFMKFYFIKFKKKFIQ